MKYFILLTCAENLICYPCLNIFNCKWAAIVELPSLAIL